LKNSYNKSAFTLSEVLISLVIIGVIAAITLPTLIQKYQDQALKSALKKNYSVLKSALDKYQVDNGERLLAGGIKGRKLKSILIKYLNIMTDCDFGWYAAGDITKACIKNYEDETRNSQVYKTYNNKTYIALEPFDDGQFILNDGSIILIDNAISTPNRIYISVDVNGMDKKPNRLGKDLFMFQLMSNGELLPMGAKGTDYYSLNDAYCSNTSTGNMNGAGCTAKVLRD
jgi:prepilin-type N-terminal cleavage/methylation domain-containing protein